MDGQLTSMLRRPGASVRFSKGCSAAVVVQPVAETLAGTGVDLVAYLAVRLPAVLPAVS